MTFTPEDTSAAVPEMSSSLLADLFVDTKEFDRSVCCCWNLIFLNADSFLHVYIDCRIICSNFKTIQDTDVAYPSNAYLSPLHAPFS